MALISAATLDSWIATFTFGPSHLLATIMSANAQFKVVGPPPYPPNVARQKIRTLLEAVDPANRVETVKTLSGLLSWYRDPIDDELIAAWQKDGRANLTELMEPLADARVAVGVIEFSWRQQRQAAFRPEYAPMFVNLMTRFPESAQPFLADLLGGTPNLSQPEAETVCRILLDMPDVGTWKKNASPDPASLPPRSRESSGSGSAWERPGEDLCGRALAGRS